MANDRPISMKTKEYRKVVKPLLERRRRARINSCLNELRNFILEATKQDSVQASKLEKADILEMTVHYLRLLLRQQCASSSRTNVNDVGRFKAGFTECANEVSLFVSSMATVNPQTRSRLLGHLSKCLGHLECVNTNNPLTVPSTMQVSPSGVASGTPGGNGILPSPPSTGLSPCYSLPPDHMEPLSPPQSLPSTPAFPVSPHQQSSQFPSHCSASKVQAASSIHWHDRDDRRTSSQPYDVTIIQGSASPYASVQRYASPLTSPSTCSSYVRSPVLRMKQEPPRLITVMDDQHMSSSVWRPW